MQGILQNRQNADARGARADDQRMMGIGLRSGLLERGTYSTAFTRGLGGLLRYCVNGDFSTELSCPGCQCPGEGAAKGSVQAYITEKQPVHDEHHSFGAFMPALVEAYRNGFTEMDFPVI